MLSNKGTEVSLSNQFRFRTIETKISERTLEIQNIRKESMEFGGYLALMGIQAWF